MPLCHVHGRFDDDDGCPDCRRAEERIEENRESLEGELESIKESVEAAAYASANPGDYECPRCRYISLKNKASRCPLCQGNVDADYWVEVRRNEAERSRRAAEEYERAAPQRAAARSATGRRAAADRANEFTLIVMSIYFLYLLPILAFFTSCSRWSDPLADVIKKFMGESVIFIPGSSEYPHRFALPLHTN